MKTKMVSSSQFADRIIEKTAVGAVQITAGEKGIVRLNILAESFPHAAIFQIGNPTAERIVEQAVIELTQYFEGALDTFSVPFFLESRSAFQQKVLMAVSKIPYGHVMTYGEIAARIGQPTSARAVGGALAKNPIMIMIPCHRVVAHNGKLHGFSSPKGIQTKAWLLQHEGLSVIDERVRIDRVYREVAA